MFAVVCGYTLPAYSNNVFPDRKLIIDDINKQLPNLIPRLHLLHSVPNSSSNDDDDFDDDNSSLPPPPTPSFESSLKFDAFNLLDKSPRMKKNNDRMTIPQYRSAAITGVLNLVDRVQKGVQTGGRVVVVARGNCWLNILANGIRANGIVSSKNWTFEHGISANHQVVKANFIFANNEVSTIRILFTSHGGSESLVQQIEAAGKDAELFLEALDNTTTSEDMQEITIDEKKLYKEKEEE